MRILLSAHSRDSKPEANQIACLPFSRTCGLLNAETQESPAGVSRDAKAVVSHATIHKDPLLSYALFWNLQAIEKAPSHPPGRGTPAMTQTCLEGIMLKGTRQTHIRFLHGSTSVRDLEWVNPRTKCGIKFAEEGWAIKV